MTLRGSVTANACSPEADAMQVFVHMPIHTLTFALLFSFDFLLFILLAHCSSATVEEQWESHSALKVDELTFEKMAFECFGTTTGDLFFVYTYSASFTTF
jgi:hypothetical protein